MTQASVTMVAEMQFKAETESGHSFFIDANPDVGGRNTGPRPMEVMAASLAGCTAMDVISILRKMQQPVTGLKVTVTGDRAADHPKKFVSVHVEYTVFGSQVAADRVKRAIELSETRYCSAMASLDPAISLTSSFTIVETAGAKAG